MTGIIGFIAFVFIFFGVFNPKATRGLHEGAVAGTVNGESIAISEFRQALSREISFYKSLLGQDLSEDQIKAFRLKEKVFQSLAGRKLLLQESERQRIQPSDEEVKEQILTIPSFQKDGKFDLSTYKQLLESGHLTASLFESKIREDLTQQQWINTFRQTSHVSESEVRQAFQMKQDRRKIKFVVFSPEARRPTPASAEKEGTKTPPTQTPAPDREEALKIAQQQAESALKWLKADAPSDKALEAHFKPLSVQVKTSDWIDRRTSFIPGIGVSPELIRDLFSKSETDPSSKKTAQLYSLPGRWVVALVTESQTPEWSQFESKKEALLSELTQKKAQTFYETWMKDLLAQAKIETNSAVVGSSD